MPGMMDTVLNLGLNDNGPRPAPRSWSNTHAMLACTDVWQISQGIKAQLCEAAVQASEKAYPAKESIYMAASDLER